MICEKNPNILLRALKLEPNNSFHSQTGKNSWVNKTLQHVLSKCMKQATQLHMYMGAYSRFTTYKLCRTFNGHLFTGKNIGDDAFSAAV